jgi:hypothetical protein
MPSHRCTVHVDANHQNLFTGGMDALPLQTLSSVQRDGRPAAENREALV